MKKRSVQMISILLALVFTVLLGVQGVAFAAEEPAATVEVTAEDALPPDEDAEIEPVAEVDMAAPEEAPAEQAALPAKQEAQEQAATFSISILDGQPYIQYTGTDDTVVFPSVYNGYAIVGVLGVADSSLSYVKKVTVSQGISTIRSQAFTGCRNLLTVVLPSSVNSIGYAAFQGCVSLTSITIPNRSVNISNRASQFSGCDTSRIWVKGIPGTQSEQLALESGARFRSLIAFTVPAPKNLKVQMHGTGVSHVRITFQQSRYAQKYKIYRSLKKGSGYKLLTTLSPGTVAEGRTEQYIDKKAYPGRTYYYKVKAISNYRQNPTGSKMTNPRAIKPMLPAPTSIGGYGGMNFVNLTWSMVTGASGYLVYRSPGNNDYTLVATIGSVGMTQYRDNDVPGNAYFYKVVPYRNVDGRKLRGHTSAVAKFGRV